MADATSGPADRTKTMRDRGAGGGAGEVRRQEAAAAEAEAVEVEAAENDAVPGVALSLRITRELDAALKRRAG